MQRMTDCEIRGIPFNKIVQHIGQARRTAIISNYNSKSTLCPIAANKDMLATHNTPYKAPTRSNPCHCVGVKNDLKTFQHDMDNKRIAKEMKEVNAHGMVNYLMDPSKIVARENMLASAQDVLDCETCLGRGLEPSELET